MSSRLERMIQESRKGCIDDHAKIRAVIMELSDMRLAKLQTMLCAESRRNIDIMVRGFLNEENEMDLSDLELEQAKKTLRLPDLMHLINETRLDARGKDAPADGCGYTDEELVYMKPYRYVGIYYLIQIFQELKKKSYPFQAFLAIQAEEFYHYQDGIYSPKARPRRLPPFQARLKALNIPMTSSTTVGEILDRASGAQKVIWCPWKSMEEYRRKILTAYRLSADLLIDSFLRIDPNIREISELADQWKQRKG